MHVIIIGAGIGGLTAAHTLLRAGFTVQIFEQATELREVGGHSDQSQRHQTASSPWDC